MHKFTSARHSTVVTYDTVLCCQLSYNKHTIHFQALRSLGSQNYNVKCHAKKLKISMNSLQTVTVKSWL